MHVRCRFPRVGRSGSSKCRARPWCWARPSRSSTSTRTPLRPLASTSLGVGAGVGRSCSCRETPSGSTPSCPTVTRSGSRTSGRAFGWFGRAWAAALSDLGVAGSVHDGRLVRSRWSAWVCFAGLGPGEVTVGDRKVVGMSQRRTRTAARFQAVAHGRWEPAAVLAPLALSPSDRRAAQDELAGAALGVEADLGLSLDALAAALLARLP